MTQPLNFTSLAPAPVSCVLACAATGDAANNLRLARAIDVELDGRGSEQHVKIKVGTLRVLVDSIQSLDKLGASLEAALGERREELIEVRDGLIEWRTYATRLLANFFQTYPTGDTNDSNLQLMITASIEHEQRKLKVVSKERDEVVHLNRNAAEEIRSLTERNGQLDLLVGEVVSQRDKNGQHANQLACEVNDLKKQRERLTHLADDYRRDLDAATQRCAALTNDAKSLTEQRDEVVTRLSNARLQIADLKRRLDGEVKQSAAVYANIRAYSEEQEGALLLRISMLEGENRQLATNLANAGLEIASYKLLTNDLKAGTAVDQDIVKRQKEAIERLSCQLNEWHYWATDVICSPSSMEPEAQRTAITQAMRKRKERTEHLEAALNSVTAQRDAWVIWAREFADAPAGLHTTEQLISMVQGKVKAETQHTFQGTLKVTKLKGDVVASGEEVKEYVLPVARGWSVMQDGNVTIQNAVIASSIPVSKVKFSEVMENAICELIQKELSPINGAIADILSKMRK